MNEFQKEEIRNMVAFPEDVIIDILVRLPSKDLARSRCVSKYWDTLITSPSFIKAHLHRASKLCHLICQESNFSELMVHELNVQGYSHMDPEEHSTSKLKMRFSGCSEFSNLDPPPAIIDGFNNFKLVDSFNGIACLYALNKTTSTSRILLWNPAINDCFVVPEPRFPMSSARNCCAGFGFNPLTNLLSDFKVMNVTLYYEGCPINEKFSPRAEIYSRRTNSWKELVGWIPKWPSSDITGNQVIFEEYVCWNPYYRTCNGDEYNDKMTIVSFNVVSEEFHEMALPDSITFNYDKGCITLLDGCVSLMVPYSECYKIWTMKEFGNIESWSKLYNIDLDSTYFSTGMSKPLGFASKDEAFYLRWYSLGVRDSATKKMCSYNTRTRNVDESKSVTFDYSFEDFCFKLYVESLISVSYVFMLEEGLSSDH